MTTRKRKVAAMTLTPEAIARLDEMAARTGTTRSGVVERFARTGEMPPWETTVKTKRKVK